jgi:hypothetical protein
VLLKPAVSEEPGRSGEISAPGNLKLNQRENKIVTHAYDFDCYEQRLHARGQL